MKRLSITLFALILSLYAIADDSGTCGYNLRWTYKEATKTLTIYGSGDMDGYNNMTLTSSGGGTSAPWYNYRSLIETIEIGDDVTSIGQMAFYLCRKITQINLPNKIKTIGPGAFYRCEGLTTISIPNSVTSIGVRAFEGTGWFNNISSYGPVYLEDWLIGYKDIKPYGNITIASGTKGIVDGALYDCQTLESVFIPDGVAFIGKWAFQNCI